MIEIAGDQLEGGGQILRSALAFSALTQRSFKVFNIRGKRPNPGLRPQHFKGFETMKILCHAKITGLEVGSKVVSFEPQGFYPQNLNIDIGTAGSVGLLLQSISLPLVLLSSQKVEVKIRGGTHVKAAVPIDYYINIINPILKLIGVNIEIELENHGYYPKGGGEVKIKFHPWQEKRPLFLSEQGKLLKIRGISHASSLLQKSFVAERQAVNARKILAQNFNVKVIIDVLYFNTASPGSGIILWAEFSNHAIIGADALGEKGKPGEKVGEEAAKKLIKEIKSGAAVDSHLADNLIPWMAISGGKILVSEITLHTKTNIWVAELFMGKRFNVMDERIIEAKI